MQTSLWRIARKAKRNKKYKFGNLYGLEWSSYKDYVVENKQTDVEFVYNVLGTNSKEKFKVFVNKENDDKCLEIKEETKRITDQEVIEIIKEKFDIQVMKIQNISLEEQTIIIKYLKGLEGTSYKQISRITGFSVHKIFKVK